MPIYTIKCEKCGKLDDIYRSVANFDDLPECCGARMVRTLSAPIVMADIQPSRSMVTGEEIGSRSAHREHLKRHGLVEIGNETKYLKPRPIEPPAGLKETIIRVANEKLRG